MTLYYAQIVEKNSKKILTGSYSSNGLPLRENKKLLHELKDILAVATAENDRIFTRTSNDNNYTLSLLYKGSLGACLICDRRDKPQEQAGFVGDLLGEYTNTYSDSSSASHYDFDETVKRICDEFNKKSRLSRGVEELESAHSILVENLDTLINRGENLNSLKNLADKVNFEAREMSRKVAQIRRNAMIEKYKMYVGVGVVLLVLFYFLFLR